MGTPARIAPSLKTEHVLMLVAFETLIFSGKNVEAAQFMVDHGQDFNDMAGALKVALAQQAGITFDGAGNPVFGADAEAPLPVDVIFPSSGIRTLFTPKVGHITAFPVQLAAGAVTLDVSMSEHGGEPTPRRMWLGKGQEDMTNAKVEGLAGGGPTPSVVIPLDGSKGFKGGDVVYVLHAYEADLDGTGQAKAEASAMDVKVS
jgi:hypothetical protein